MADMNYVPQVDYTSRDYLSIRDDLISLIPTFAPQWTNRDPSDFGIAILQMFSYMGDLMSYYVDRSANEAFISTASKRSSILRHAALLDYQPTQSTPAIVELTFSNSSASPVTIPAGTQVATSTTVSGENTQIIFETNEEITVAAISGSTPGTETVLATQGQTVTAIGIPELVKAASTGQPNQVYALEQYPVIDDSISVTIDGIVYEKVQYLIDVPGTTPAFTSFTDADGITYIQFGDNIGGKIPPLNKAIYALYRIGGGTTGNVPAGSITEIDPNGLWGGQPSGLTVVNVGSAAGGEDPESTDSIKINAPLSIKSLNRAVSLADYSSLALQVGGVAKAISTADSYSSIVLYFAPFGDRGVEIDNVTPTAVFTALASNVSTYMTGKAPANTTLTIAPPEYVGVDIYFTITVLPQFRQFSVQQAVLTAIGNILAFDSVLFADRISLQYVMKTIGSVPGVDYTDIRILRRADEQQMFNIGTKALTSNVATLTTKTTHNLTIGQTVVVDGVDATFNGTYVVTAVPSSTTFSYAKTSTNVNSTNITEDITITNKELTGNIATLTTSSAHPLEVGDVITVENIDSNFNGKYRVYTVPSATTFTYIKVASNVASTAVSPTGHVWSPYVQVLKVEDVVCGTNEIPEAGDIRITAQGGITT